MVVDTHRQELCGLAKRISQQRFQLNELFDAVGSPVATVENQDNVLLAMELGERDRRALFIF